MATTLISGPGAVWEQIRRDAAKAARADVAVAYFGGGGANRLPLRAGSRLTVDASEATLQAGGTSPAELLRLPRTVQIFNRPLLHAKVYVFPKVAYIGSANNSGLSEAWLSEAMIRTTDPKAIHQAREFVISMCEGLPLGPEELRRLEQFYRRPKLSIAKVRRARRASRVWLDHVPDAEYPDDSEETRERIHKAADRKRTPEKGYDSYEIWWPKHPRYREGDTVFCITRTGGKDMVSPPARVVHVETDDAQEPMAWHVVEHRESRQVALKRVAKALSPAFRKRKRKLAPLRADLGRELLNWWNNRS